MKEKYFSYKYLISFLILFTCLFIFSITSLALIPGDFGSAGGGPPDGCVDFEDLMIFAMAYGSTPADANWNVLCDIAGQGTTTPDGVIDFEDLMIFALNYGESAPPSAPALSDPGTTLPSPANYTVSWSAVTEATSYVLQEATSSDFTSGLQEYPLTDISKSFSHTVTTTTTYYYRVAAVNSYGQSGWSSVEDITVVIVTGPVHNLTKNIYYNTIQEAFDDADSLGGDTIEVDDGTYNESITFPTGKLVTLQSTSGIRDNVIIQGANNLSTVTINGSSTGTTLSGFTITHTSGDTGKGIYIKENGNLIIDNCIISGNSTANYGGGICNWSGTLTITGSTISGNTAGTYGGGIYNWSGTLTITSSTISSNTAYAGGGIYNNGGTITITSSSTISGNTANYAGGGIDNHSGTLTITGSTISGNTAGTYGGGIYNNQGTLTITGSTTISGNTANNDGGGICNYYASSSTITESTISGNTANNKGGGICNHNDIGTLTIISSTIFGNTADYGGGIRNHNSTLTITSSDISGNNVSQQGGGIYLEGTGTITIGGSSSIDSDNFNTFTDNKKDGIISAYQHIRNIEGDCHLSYPYNYYNPN